VVVMGMIIGRSLTPLKSSRTVQASAGERQLAWPRARYAIKTVFLAQRRDGHLAPAWGRYVANTVNNVIENAWLPPSVTTSQGTVVRSGEGFLGRLAGNLFAEFWPDAQRWMSGKPKAPQ